MKRKARKGKLDTLVKLIGMGIELMKMKVFCIE